MKIMTFLTDFGSNSNYVSQMKGVALSITDAKLIDINHDISSHNIREGAFVLYTSVPSFPVGTVHVAVVDPGVGSSRRGIVVTTRSHILIGPDNGLLIPVAKHLGDFNVYEISNPNIMLKSVSNTFHGRDVFTPVAAHILNGLEFHNIGPIITDYVDFDFGKFEIRDKSAKGKAIYIDKFGNIITNIDGTSIQNFLAYDSKITLNIRNKKINVPFVRTYDLVKKGGLLATIGSSDLLEISQNQGNAAKKLGIKIDEDIKILLP